MGMNLDLIFSRQEFKKLEDLLSRKEDKIREDIANDIIEFSKMIHEKYKEAIKKSK